jgi:hypothetical protein
VVFRIERRWSNVSRTGTDSWSSTTPGPHGNLTSKRICTYLRMVRGGHSYSAALSNIGWRPTDIGVWAKETRWRLLGVSSSRWITTHGVCYHVYLTSYFERLLLYPVGYEGVTSIGWR